MADVHTYLHDHILAQSSTCTQSAVFCLVTSSQPNAGLNRSQLYNIMVRSTRSSYSCARCYKRKKKAGPCP